ncbi:hypothetical protein HMPREF0877_0198 [Weissella paramesenteroides ATCC 33313]|uniref:Uncharacterized protein n=1 Tax=Weissella paramesenteroides ATCC 33313 TaxID=585506 RepID=C5R8A3_WEIPA|nr:hypothetical protein HMPREF0877_0198 [Weissella paramesenteroides ATCC 33313]
MWRPDKSFRNHTKHITYKKIANRRVRRAEFILPNKGYRKQFESWEIVDFRSRNRGDTPLWKWKGK